jgi:hypothetical protein
VEGLLTLNNILYLYLRSHPILINITVHPDRNLRHSILAFKPQVNVPTLVAHVRTTILKNNFGTF